MLRSHTTKIRRLLALLAGCAAAVPASPVLAQGAPDLRLEATAGSEAEDYLRTLQVAGMAPLHPWFVRSFSPAEIDRLAPTHGAHPWASRFAGDTAAPALRLIRPRARAFHNTAFPVPGRADGPIWAGRGMTGALSAGVALRAGPLSLRLEPLVFWTQNSSFELMQNGETGDMRFASGLHPRTIDQPQRFGDGAYTRVDPGQSTLRLDALGVAAGISTANQVWGPAADLPMILGANAGGFPHAFVGTSAPVPVGIGRLHGRVVWGDLRESEYTTVAADSGSRRFMAGWVVSFQPAGLRGVELGISRFFHSHWPEGGLTADDFLEPLQPFLKEDLEQTGVGGDRRSDFGNQIAAVQARWVLPGSGFELYGEYGREDHNWDVRDFLLEPDHAAAYMVGGRKVWVRDGQLLSLRAEVVSSAVSHIREVRAQSPFYIHTRTRQGHTVNGQILGSPAVYGGGGSVVALESHTRRGRWHVDWTRTRIGGARSAEDTRVDVIHSIGGEALLFRGGLDVTAGARGNWNLNRHYQGNAFSLTTELGLRARL